MFVTSILQYDYTWIKCCISASPERKRYFVEILTQKYDCVKVKPSQTKQK